MHLSRLFVQDSTRSRKGSGGVYNQRCRESGEIVMTQTTRKQELRAKEWATAESREKSEIKTTPATKPTERHRYIALFIQAWRAIGSKV